MTINLTSLTLFVLMLLAFAAGVIGIVRLRGGQPFGSTRQLQFTLVGLVIVGCLALFIYRAAVVYHRWQPLQAHVDGLLLIASLFGATILLLQRLAHLPGLNIFALPLLAILVAWAFCASGFTFQPFHIHSVWTSVHLAGAYLGTLFFAIAAIAGGMYLYVERRLRRHENPGAPGRLASLEALEGLIVRCAAVGFSLLTLGLAAVAVMVMSEHRQLAPGWWYSWKVLLSFAVWLIYAVVMNVRHATRFRGARAAWMSILGLILLIATFAVVSATPSTILIAETPQPAGQDDAATTGNANGEVN